jgi:hypothetical protein
MTPGVIAGVPAPGEDHEALASAARQDRHRHLAELTAVPGARIQGMVAMATMPGLVTAPELDTGS